MSFKSTSHTIEVPVVQSDFSMDMTGYVLKTYPQYQPFHQFTGDRDGFLVMDLTFILPTSLKSEFTVYYVKPDGFPVRDTIRSTRGSLTLRSVLQVTKGVAYTLFCNLEGNSGASVPIDTGLFMMRYL